MCVNIVGGFYVLGSSSSRDRNSLLEQVRQLESQLNELRSQVVPPIPHVSALRTAQLEAGGRRQMSSPVVPPPPTFQVIADVHQEDPRPGTSRDFDLQVRSVESLRKDFLKREYQLTTTSRLDIWTSNLGCECRAKGLPDVTNVGVNFEQVDPMTKSWIRDLINTRINEHYQGQLLGVSEPHETFRRIIEIKRLETNQSTAVARKRFADLKLGKTERLAAFFKRFERAVWDLELLGEKVNGRAQCDQLLNSTLEVYPNGRNRVIDLSGSVKVDYITYKNVLLQEEQLRPKTATGSSKATTRPTLILRPGQPKKSKTGRRCFGCGAYGHIYSECPAAGELYCFNCKKYGKHIARDCDQPARPRQESRGGRSSRRGQRYPGNRAGTWGQSKFKRFRARGLKRFRPGKFRRGERKIKTLPYKGKSKKGRKRPSTKKSPVQNPK